MSAEHIHNFYLCWVNSPLAALLALSFADGPSYNGFVLAAVREKLHLPMRMIQGVGGWAKDLLVLNSESMVMMRRRVPKGHLFMTFSLPCLSNYFGHHPPSNFGLRRLSTACLHSVPALPFALAELLLCVPISYIKAKITALENLHYLQ